MEQEPSKIKNWLNKKTGIGKPIICSRCGKKVGFVSLRMRAKTKFIVTGFIIAIVTQLVAQVPAQMFSDYFLYHLLNYSWR